VTKQRILVVYYSSSGTTRKVAEAVAAALSADIEQIRPVNRVDASIGSKGLGNLINIMRLGFGAMTKRAAALQGMSKDPADYATVVIGTPVYAGSVSAPVRSYLEQYRQALPQVALFCTGGDAENQKVVDQMQDIVGKPPRASAVFQASAVQADEHQEQLDAFVAALQG
jgi:menaquinone-dependent protoporphyrinogen IX oxidase